MAAHNDFGVAAEERAARLLLSRGWTVLARNWRWGRKEIDIIARRGGIVAFVEVRARRTEAWGHPFETIGWRKRREVATAARAWIARHGRPGEEYRLDAIAVVDAAATAGSDAVQIEHLEDAWRID